MIEMMRSARRSTAGTASDKGRALQICLDAPRVAQPQWCWRDDWVQGQESIYSLIGQFQVLNVVGAKQVRAAFVEAVQPGTSIGLRTPVVDLIRTDRIRLASFAAAVRLPVDVVRLGFVSEAFPTSGWRGHADLRWCSECVKSGYHTPMFQLPMVEVCPAHHGVLKHRCPRCRSPFPYQLTTLSQLPLFCCPSCKWDLISSMRSGSRLALTSSHLQLLKQRSALLQFVDSLPSVFARHCGNGPSLRTAALVMSPPSVRGNDGEFRAFIARVLASLEATTQGDWDQCNPTYTYVERNVALRRSRGSTTAAGEPGWSEHLVPRSDERLRRVVALYRCVRRHVWRNLVRSHRRCVSAVCRRMWWPIVGSDSPPFCPVAAAFLRWRLRWESAIRLSDMLNRPNTPPLGLVTWLASSPIAPPSCTRSAQDWLVDHVLGFDLLGDFDAILGEEMVRRTDQPIYWVREWADGAGQSCWVCAGSGTKSNPFRLFVDNTSPIPQSMSADEVGHYWDHLAIVGKIEH